MSQSCESLSHAGTAANPCPNGPSQRPQNSVSSLKKKKKRNQDASQGYSRKTGTSTLESTNTTSTVCYHHFFKPIKCTQTLTHVQTFIQKSNTAESHMVEKTRERETDKENKQIHQTERISHPSE